MATRNSIQEQPVPWPLAIVAAGLLLTGLCFRGIYDEHVEGAAARNEPGQFALAAQLNGRQRVDGRHVEPLTRGPIHEAFAGQYNLDPVPGLIVPAEPPPPVPELPPEEMPAGENVEWIHGYWAWDDEREDFLWVSGAWRMVPPGYRWVPGYWLEVEEGFQWIPGFWAGADLEEVMYVPVPPESLEEGPTSPQPGPDFFWVPGTWMFVDEEGDFRWRPGYWARAHEQWVWIPARYIWTPAGCVFVSGHWDYHFPRRGVLFAPIVFHQPVFVQPGFFHTPVVVIDARHLFLQMFVRPQFGHYYFGDFFGPQYAALGIQPWHAFWDRPGFYDPMLTYYDWFYGRRDVNFVQNIQTWNQFFVRNERFRPPHTFAQQSEFVSLLQEAPFDLPVDRLAVAAPMEEFVQRVDRVQPFRRIEEPRRRDFAQRADRLRRFSDERVRIERETVPIDVRPDRVRPERRRLRLPDVEELRPDVPERDPRRPRVRPEERPEPPVERPERPEPSDPRVRPPVERPDPPVERPDPRVRPPVERPDPPVERPERPDPRLRPPVERPERPDPRVRPPVERPDPPVERPERPDPRVRPEVRPREPIAPRERVTPRDVPPRERVTPGQLPRPEVRERPDFPPGRDRVRREVERRELPDSRQPQVTPRERDVPPRGITPRDLRRPRDPGIAPPDATERVRPRDVGPPGRQPEGAAPRPRGAPTTPREVTPRMTPRDREPRESPRPEARREAPGREAVRPGPPPRAERVQPDARPPGRERGEAKDEDREEPQRPGRSGRGQDRERGPRRS